MGHVNIRLSSFDILSDAHKLLDQVLIWGSFYSKECSKLKTKPFLWLWSFNPSLLRFGCNNVYCYYILDHLSQNLVRDHAHLAADQEATREAIRNTGQGHDRDRDIVTLTAGEVDLVAEIDTEDNTTHWTALCSIHRFWLGSLVSSCKW